MLISWFFIQKIKTKFAEDLELLIFFRTIHTESLLEKGKSNLKIVSSKYLH